MHMASSMWGGVLGKDMDVLHFSVHGGTDCLWSAGFKDIAS